MNDRQQLIYDGLNKAVALANAREPMSHYEVVEPVARYLVTFLSLLQGYDAIDKETLDKLLFEYDTSETPNYSLAVLLQMINVLDMTERTVKREH